MLAVTPGEPAGIGPDLVIQYAQNQKEDATPWVVVADADMLRQRAQLLGLPLQIQDDLERSTAAQGLLGNPHTLPSRVQPGQQSGSCPTVLAALDHAYSGAMSGTFRALVTGPIETDQ